jgi:hypothetical protein
VKTLKLLLLANIILLASCSRTTDGESDASTLKKPAKMTTFCQYNPDEPLEYVEYTYKKGLLVLEEKIDSEGFITKTVYKYNAKNQIDKITETSDGESRVTKHNYNAKNQLIRIDFSFTSYDNNGNIDGTINNTETFEYENDLLSKKTEYWGGTRTYEYDANKRLIKENVFYKTGELHSTVYYSYVGNLKIEEWAVSANIGTERYRHHFQYNSNNFLEKVLENDKAIEEYFYNGNKLLEKRETYYGTDPGYYFCLGNFIYKYEY